jgi:hypothetical protein
MIPKSKIYFASSCGRVGSLYKRGARTKLTDKIRELKKSSSTNGYELVHLYENDKRRTAQVHRLIAATFLGESNLCVNHKDLNKKNNALSNLEYVTYKENYAHAKANGVTKNPPRNAHKFRKLNKQQVFEVIASQDGCNILGRKYKIQSSTIVKIRSGKAYKDWHDEFYSKV